MVRRCAASRRSTPTPNRTDNHNKIMDVFPDLFSVRLGPPSVRGVRVPFVKWGVTCRVSGRGSWACRLMPPQLLCMGKSVAISHVQTLTADVPSKSEGKWSNALFSTEPKPSILLCLRSGLLIVFTRQLPNETCHQNFRKTWARFLSLAHFYQCLPSMSHLPIFSI